MPKKNNLLTVAGVFGILAVGIVGGLTLSANAFGGPVFNNTDAQEALENNNYEAFKGAITEASNKRAENFSQEDFDQMRDRYLNREVVKEAIENNDWQAYQEATTNLDQEQNSRRAGPKIAQTEEEFAEVVTFHQQALEFKTELTEFVEDDDFDGFYIALKQQHQNRQENVPENSPVKNFELTEEEARTFFDRAKEQLENGQEITLGARRGSLTNRGGGRRIGN